VTLQTQRVQTLEQVRQVVQGKEDKSAVKAYLAKMMGLSCAAHPADGTVPLDGAYLRPSQRRVVAAVHEALHCGRYPPARRGRHRAQPALRAGHPGDAAPPVRDLAMSASCAWRGER